MGFSISCFLGGGGGGFDLVTPEGQDESLADVPEEPSLPEGVGPPSSFFLLGN